MRYFNNLLLFAAVGAAAAITSAEVGLADNGCVESVPEGGNATDYHICRVHLNGHTLPEPRDEDATVPTKPAHAIIRTLILAIVLLKQ
ncbi:hypothetical protein BKA66DRAFT_479922 [Pyrenochaeta sp. MPI-SDFR-AT-0127]|nr:hypothetical protein BKA66DRAFT_479922 [Pyrenochaeta sp. MPI-SDFR-AT-0127]